MALLSRLRVNSPVRVKHGFRTPSGLSVIAGETGVVGKVAPYRNNYGVICVWVWFEKGRGAWCPVDAIARRKVAT